MQQILVVANQSVGSDELAAEITARLTFGPCQFLLLMPPLRRRSPHQRPLFGVGIAAQSSLDVPDVDDDIDWPAAERRLDEALQRFRSLGATIDGVVGDPDPMRAIGTILGRRHVDEIVISTLPTARSSWLRQDLPTRVKRKFKLPTTVITPTLPAPTTT